MIAHDAEANFLQAILHGAEPATAAQIFADWLDEQTRGEEAAAWRAMERGLRTAAWQAMMRLKGVHALDERLSLVESPSHATLFTPASDTRWRDDLDVDVRWSASRGHAMRMASDFQWHVLRMIGRDVDVSVRRVTVLRTIPIFPAPVYDATLDEAARRWEESLYRCRVEHVEIRALAVAVGEHWLHHRAIGGRDAAGVV